MKTPCINVCKINPQTKLCDGCGRTIDEISYWSKYSDSERATIINRVNSREEILRRYDRG
jgi:predicted Fe-S protein YdhL (DUF1289 family)